jgi:hypothetical protein
MDFPTSTPSPNFDYLADPVDTSFLQDYNQTGLTDLLSVDYGASVGTQPINDQISAGMEAYVNAKPTYQAANQPTYYNPEGLNVDRYAQSTYYGLKGFSPELGQQNEYRYGQMQTWGDMMGNSFAGAYKLGAQTFVDGWKGWGRMTDALVNLDASKLVGSPDELLELSKEHESIMNKYAIFATPESEENILSKQFLGNMIQQSGFALGATAQFLSEELLTMGLSTGFSLTKLGLTSGAKLARGAYRTGELMNDAKKLGDIWKYDGVVNNIWNGAKKLVPLVGTVNDVTKASRAGASALQLASIGLGGVKRSLAEMNMAMTEARMEAAGTYGELYTRMSREFTAANGREPLGQELENIKELALSGAQDNFKVNTGVLAVANRIQFDNIFSKFGTERRIMKAFGEMADDVVKVTGKVGEKETTRLVKSGIDGLGDIAQTFGKRKAAWEGTKQLGKTMSKWEVSEGIQEMIQTGSNVAIQDYYMDLYSGDPASWRASASTGYDSQLSKEGFKTFLMGALTGRLISPITGLIGKGMNLVNTTSQQRAERKATLEESIGLINNFYENPKLALSEAIANFKVQQKAAENMTEALKNRDEYYYNNSKDSALAKLVSAAIKTDMLESVVDTIRGYGDALTVEQMKEAFPAVDANADNITNAKGYFTKIAGEVESFAKNWEHLNDIYGDIVMPELYAEGTEERKQALIAKKAVQDAIEILATNRFKGERAQERMQKIYAEIQQNQVIGNSSAAAFRILGSDQLMMQEIELITSELVGLQVIDNPDQATKDQIKAKKAELQAITEWKESWLPVPSKDKLAMMNTPALKKAYAAYVSAKNVSNRIDQVVSNTDVDTSWTSFMDYVNLNQDMTQFTDAYNTLANPMAFTKMVNQSREAIQALLERLKQQAIEDATNASDKAERKKITLTLTDKEGVQHEIEITEGGRYITEADPVKRLSPEGVVKDTYNQDIIFIKKIEGDAITVEINGSKTPVTYTTAEFIERAGRLWDLKTMEPSVRMYFMNRDKEFKVSVRTKTGKPHKVGGKHAKNDYSAAGVLVDARLELEKEEDGKYHLKVTYKNPYTKQKESFPYNPIYMSKYRTGVTDLTTLPELEEGLAAQAEQRRKDNLALQLEVLEELIDEQEANMESTKANVAMTRSEVDDLKKELQDLLFVAEELEKLDPKDVKQRNQYKKLVNVKKIAEIKEKIPVLKARIAELEEKSAQLEAEIETMEELYLAYLEAQQDLQTEQEPYDRNGRENIYVETEERIAKLDAEKLTSYIPDDMFGARIDAIQQEKDLIDTQIAYVFGVIQYLEKSLANYTDYQDIMDLLGDPNNLTTSSSTAVLPTQRGKISPQTAGVIYDVEKIRTGLVRIKNLEMRQENPDKEKLATIDYMLTGLALDNDRVLDENKLNAIDAITFAQKIAASKTRLSELLERAAQLQDKIDEWTIAKAQREELTTLRNRVEFLKKIWEPLANRAKRKIQDKKVKIMVSQAQLKEQNKKLASVALEQDNEAPTFKDGARTSFARVGFKKTFGRHYNDENDTDVNTENGSDRFYRFTANVAVTGKGFVLQVVTKNNAARLGLQSIMDTQYNENDIKLVVMKRVANAQGLIEYKYVGVDGNVLADQDVNPDNMVYRSMTNISKYDVNRIRQQIEFSVDDRITDAQIEQRIAEHEAYQTQVTERTGKEDVYLNVVGSTPGIQRVQRLEDGSIEQAPVDGRVIEEESDYTTMRSATNRNNLIELRVSTSKDQSAGVGILPGRVIMQEYFFDAQGTKVRTDKVFRVFNRPLEDAEKENLAQVLIRFSELFGRNYTKEENQKLTEAEKAEFDMILSYLTGILPWGIPQKQAVEASDRFFWVDNGLHRGSQVIEFSENGIRLNKDLLFENMFHHVNHAKLTKNVPFNTVKLVNGKAVIDQKYDSYSAYLLAKREDGATPPVYTSLPRVDDVYPQRTNAQLIWNDPSVAPEMEINLEPKERKQAGTQMSDRKQIEAGIDAIIDGAATEVKIYGFVINMVTTPQGIMFKVTMTKNNQKITKDLFPEPLPSLDILKKPENRKKVYELIKAATGFGYGEKSVLESFGGVKVGTPAPAGTDNRVELQKLQAEIRKAADLTGMMDTIFSVLDEKEYADWQNTIDVAELERSVTLLIQNVKTREEAEIIASRYLLDKFIDKKLKDLGPVQGKAAPTLNTTQTPTATVAQSTLARIATKINNGTQLTMVESITYQKNKAAVDAIIASSQNQPAGTVQNQPVNKPQTTLPLDINSAVAQATQTGDSLSATVYTVNQAGESKVLYSATTTIPNGNIALAKANLQTLLEEQHDTDLGDFRIAFKEAEQTEDFGKLSAWMKTNLPQIPVSVMSHLINGKAWGQFVNGAIYIYQNAEVGTGFHEAFEAVYKSYLTDAQQAELATEFKARTGTFYNPFTKETKNYADATDFDVKEMLAEEFRAYVLNDTAPKSTKVKSFFQKVWEAIQKLLGLTPQQDAEMSGYINSVFKQISTGAFANAKPIRERNYSESEFKAVPGFTQQETSDLVEGLTYYFFTKIYEKGSNIDSLLGDMSKDESSALFNELYNEAYNKVRGNTIIKDATLAERMDIVADGLKDEFKKYVSRFGLQFEEDSFAKEENAVDTLGIRDSMTVDPRKGSKVNIKLLLASLPMYDYTADGKVKVQKNSMMQPKLVDFDKTITLLLNELGNTVVRYDAQGNQIGALEQMLQKLDNLYLEPSGNYRNGYTWIKNMKKRLKIGEQGLTLEDMMLQTSFIANFTNVRIAPEKLIFNEDGQIYNFNPLQNKNTDRVKDSWSNNVKDTLVGQRTIWKIGTSGMIEIDPSTAGYTQMRTTLNARSQFNLDKALEMLKLFGVEFSHDTAKLQPYGANIIDDTINIMRLTLDGQIKNAVDLYSGEVISARMNRLLSLEANFSGEENILSYNNASGMPKYAVSIPSLFSNTINTLNAVGSLTELIQTAPWLGIIDNQGRPQLFPYQENSMVLKPDGILFDKNGNKRPGVKVNFHDISGVGMNESDGVDTADLQFPDRAANKIHYIMKNVTFSNINSDKSTEFGIGFTKGTEALAHVVTAADVKEFLYSGGSEKIMNIFMDQLRDEVSAAVMEKLRPSNVEVYSQAVLNLGHFEDILKPSGLLAKFQKEMSKKSIKMADGEKFLKNNATEIKAAITTYLNSRVEETVGFLQDLDLIEQIPNSQDFATDAISNQAMKAVLGIAPGDQNLTRGEITRAFFTPSDIKAYAGFLALNEEIMIAEQHKLIYGHPSMYKDLPKRANGPTATKEEMVQDESVIDWMDSNMPRVDEKVRTEDQHQLMKVVTFEDQSVISEHYQDIAEGLYEMLRKALGDKAAMSKIGAQFSSDGTFSKFIKDKDNKYTGFIKAYVELNEADAMAYGMPDMVRDILFKTGKLSKDQIKQFDYEIAYEKLVRSGRIKGANGKVLTKEDDAFFGNYYEDAELDAAMEVYKKGDPGYIFQVLKTQYFGYAAGKEVDGVESSAVMTHPVFLKHSVQPKFFRHVEGTAFEKVYLAAQANQVDVIGFQSGEKVGNVTNPQGKATPLYKADGTVNIDGLMFPQDLTQQQLYSRFFGIQVATADFAKDKVVRGTQVTKLIMLNFFENGVADPEIAAIIREYNDTLVQMMKLGKQELLKELGLQQTADGYVATDLSKLVSILRREAISRDLPDNMIDAINAENLIDGTSKLQYDFDTLINREKIDNILNSIVDSRVISEKMSGKSAIQVASTMYEKDPRKFMVERNGVYVSVEEALKVSALTPAEQATVRMMSNDLKSYYRKDGTVQRMEVYINWPFGSLRPEALGLKLENGVYKIPENFNRIDKVLLEAIGFRIPTQSMNSIEAIVIKGFVPSTGGDMVVVPSDLVGKSGSDFDIDKLNIYLANFKVEDRSLQSPEFRSVVSTYLMQNFLWTPTMIDTVLDGIGKEGLDRINKATFTERGREFHEADESLEDIAEELGGKDAYDKLWELKKALQAYNKERNTFFKEKDAGQYGLFLRAEPEENTKKGLQNKLIRLMGELVLNKDNFRQLVTPNNVDNLKGLATRISAMKEVAGTVTKQNEKSRAYLRSFVGNTRVRERYLTAKRMVGISAIHSTFHSLAQVAGLQVNDVFDISMGAKYLMEGSDDRYRTTGLKLRSYPANENGTFNIGYINDIDGVAIGDRFSEATSGFVDGAKDPFVFDLNFSMDVAGTWFSMTHRGVPEEDIAFFMNQPIMDEYFMKQAKNKSLFKKANGRNKYNADLFYETVAPYFKRLKGRDILAEMARAEEISGFEAFKYKQKLATEFREISDRFTVFTVEEMEKNIAKGTKADPAFEIAVLYNYVLNSVQARHMGSFIQAIGYDNKKTKTIYENEMQVANWDRAVKVGYIANPEAILENTFIGEMKEQKEDLFKLFREFFITLDPNVRPVFQPLEEFLSDPEYVNSKEASYQLISRYQNFVVAYMLHTTAYMDETGQQKRISDMYEGLLKGAESMGNQLMKYKLSPDPRISKNLIIQELLPVLSDDTNKPNSVRLLRSRLDSIKVNKIIESVNELREFAVSTADKNLKDFVDNLAVFSILQSGVQASSLDFKKVLPVEVYSNLVRDILDNFKANPNLDAADVWRQFHQNNFSNRTIVPKFPSYVKIKNNVITISATSAVSRYQFMVKYMPKPGLTMKEAMDRGADGFTPRLFERTMLNENGKWVYTPINKKGDGRRFIEIYTDNRDSIIPENNLNMQIAPGQTMSSDGFAKITDPDFYASIYAGVTPAAKVTETTKPTAKAIAPTGNTIKFEGPGNVEKILAGTKKITNRTEKAKLKGGNGVYKIDGSPVSVNIKLLGKADVMYIGDSGLVEFEDGKSMGLDEYAKAEGFTDWADFEKNNKFSAKFIQGLESRLIYSVSPVDMPAAGAVVQPSKNALAQNLMTQALGDPGADPETMKKLNDKENESKNCNP